MNEPKSRSGETLTDEEIRTAAINAADNMDATRVSQLSGNGWKATTIFEGDTGLIRLGRLVEKAILAKQALARSERGAMPELTEAMIFAAHHAMWEGEKDPKPGTVEYAQWVAVYDAMKGAR